MTESWAIDLTNVEKTYKGGVPALRGVDMRGFDKGLGNGEDIGHRTSLTSLSAYFLFFSSALLAGAASTKCW